MSSSFIDARIYETGNRSNYDIQSAIFVTSVITNSAFASPCATMNGIIVFLLVTAFAVSTAKRCKPVKLAGLLDCTDRSLLRVPKNRYKGVIYVLDMRRNSLSSVNEKWLLQQYPRLRLIDLRENPRICGRINLSIVNVKSDCDVATSSSRLTTVSMPTSQQSTLPSTPPSTPRTASLRHVTPSTASSTIPVTSFHHPTRFDIVSKHQQSSSMAIYLSVAVATLILLANCLRCRKCWRTRTANVSMTSSDSSNIEYSTTTV